MRVYDYDEVGRFFRILRDERVSQGLGVYRLNLCLDIVFVNFWFVGVVGQRPGGCSEFVVQVPELTLCVRRCVPEEGTAAKA